MRLSDKSRPVIEATLPAVGEHIAEIAENFYRHLFAKHPELLDGTFNRGNQAQGTQQQALAGSVAAFAGALVNAPDHLPESLLIRVAHKHASLTKCSARTGGTQTTSRAQRHVLLREPSSFTRFPNEL